MDYEFQTQVGRFIIRSDPDNPGQVLLSIDNVAIGKYESAAAAANAVYSQATGWERWDLLRSIEKPRDLSEWKAG